MKRGILIGAVVILVFSVWPARTVNVLCCAGVMFGGFLAAMMTGRSLGSMLEPTVGMRAGASAGLLASVAAVVLTVIGRALEPALPVFDAIPELVYDFVYPIWSGLLDIQGRSEPSAASEPGFLWRVFFQIPTNGLFGAFGGAVAASTFRKGPPRAAPASG